MGFGSLGIFLGVVVWWAAVSLTAAATTPPTTTTTLPTTKTSQSANTTSQTIWPDYGNNSGQVFFTTIPFTYYEYVTNVIDVSNNGYVTFGSSYDDTKPPPPAEWPTDPKILGVYWSKLTPDRIQANSSKYIDYDYSRLTNVTNENSLIKYVKKTIAEPDFEPLLIIAVTWENIRPTTTDNETATFQVLLATDGQVTYAVRGYLSMWKSTELANQTYYAATYSQGYGERPKIVLPGSVAGPEVILLGTKKPNRDPYTCVEKTQEVVSRLNTSLNVLPPCPCYEVQASGDPQFKSLNASSRCYQSTNLPQGGSLYQLCCYNMYGHLLNYTKERGVPVSSNATDRSLQEAYEKCCADGSGLCEWFQGNIYLTKCANYTPAFNKSQLPSITNKLDDIVYNRNTNTSVDLSVRNNAGMTYSLMTTFNSSHGVRISGYSFRWDIVSGLDALRKASYPQLLVIYATNANNMSASFAPIYKLCLCQNETQCDTTSLTVSITRDTYGLNTFFGPDSYQRGNVNIMTCKCKGKGTGRFCERPINACDNCLVQNLSGCNSNPQGYCPACPLGYQRKGTQCLGAQTGGNNGVSGNKTVSGYLLIALSCITCYILWMKNLLTTHM